MKRRSIFLCSLALCLSITGCSGAAASSSASTTSSSVSASASSTSVDTAQADYSNQTITGKVVSMDGTSVTLQLGELTEGGPGGSSDGQTPPDMPNSDSSSDGSSDQQTPPEKPDGDASSDNSSDGSSDQQTPPEKPDGDTSSNGSSDGSSDGQTPPDMPGGDSQMGGGPGGQTFTAGESTAAIDLDGVTIQKSENGETTDASIEDISTDSILTVTFGDDNTITSVVIESVSTGGPSGNGGAPGGGSFGGSGEVTQGTAATTLDSDTTVTGETYTSTGDDENALRVDGASVTLDGITVDKSAGSSSNTEDGDFYGMNAALLATNGAEVTITNATINSSAQNGNGVFSYGEGTIVNIFDSTITTTADNSGGIQTTGGGTTNASNLTVETSGNSAAAIRSDRGGGTVNVDEGTYTSNGYNSPAVYSTADITVSNAALTANNSEALVIEGSNSITLNDCDVTGNMSDTKGSSSDENVHNVMIYQSMSGDAEVGTSSFSMTGGSLTAKNGDMFYITNTHSVISLSGVSITNEDADANLMTITGNSASHGWGSAGSNGAQAEVTASDQVLEGNIVVDTISTLNLTLSDGSTFTGTINITDNEAGGTAVSDNAVVTIDEGCTWTLTGDCTISSLTNNGTINFNGYTITLADGTVLNS